MTPPSTSPAAPVPLWRQLQAAARLVRGVREGQSLTPQLDQVPPALRPGAQALAFHALRWLGLAEGLRTRLVQRRPSPAADALLCTALALLASEEGQAAYTPFTLVDQAVEAAKHDKAMRPQAGLLNACLRRFLRERAALLAAVTTDDPAHAPSRWNHPRWWVERLKRDHPQAWQAALQAAQAHPPMVLRVNIARVSVPDFMQHLAQAGMAATHLGNAAVQLARPCPVAHIPGFADGWAAVQSASAQLAAPLLLEGLPGSVDGRPLRVLDACAAPGGKTAHLLALRPQAHVTALELDAMRARRIGENLARLGLQADVRVADAAAPAQWWQGEPFDAVLLDAPCSASGIASRHPDVRWLRREADIAQLAATQDRLLHALWPLLKPGGRLLFCTCSVFCEEGSERVQTFLAHHTDAAALPAPGHLLPTPPGMAGAVGDNAPRDDGFYYALLEKRAA
ncbi:MAG: 16S rRNA (cytosine(967)-C(5))-methyltransferase RsmB [Pseudomonadota bacterium]|nr:16S rRNA (cytosine(967)-C(5))-methyltransferase RsmB [Pseudomonadota bacterium]